MINKTHSGFCFARFQIGTCSFVPWTLSVTPSQNRLYLAYFFPYGIIVSKTCCRRNRSWSFFKHWHLCSSCCWRLALWSECPKKRNRSVYYTMNLGLDWQRWNVTRWFGERFCFCPGLCSQRVVMLLIYHRWNLPIRNLPLESWVHKRLSKQKISKIT